MSSDTNRTYYDLARIVQTIHEYDGPIPDSIRHNLSEFLSDVRAIENDTIHITFGSRAVSNLNRQYVIVFSTVAATLAHLSQSHVVRASEPAIGVS